MLVVSAVLCGQEIPDSLTAATHPDIFAEMPGAVVHQDSSIIRLLHDKVEGVVRGGQETDGFRVQIYSSNRQQTAKAEALKLEKEFSEQLDAKVYVEYNPPFWKVRVGDFLTLDEANAYKDELLNRFPQLQSSTYIVRDRVQIIAGVRP